jgi:hypothetical protein
MPARPEKVATIWARDPELARDRLLRGPLTKFEGTATVTGTYQGQQVTGYGYLELVGNWF